MGVIFGEKDNLQIKYQLFVQNLTFKKSNFYGILQENYLGLKPERIRIIYPRAKAHGY